MSGVRSRLPDRRARLGFEFEHRGIRFTCCAGFYDDGRLGEIFLSTKKTGTQVDGDVRDAALLFSLLIQRGESVENIRAALTKDAKGNAAGILGRALELIGEGA